MKKTTFGLVARKVKCCNMGAWTTASLFVASIIWTEGIINAQVFQKLYSGSSDLLNRPKRQEYGTSGEVETEPYSASSHETHNRLSPAFLDFSPNTNQEKNRLEDPFSAYSTFESFFNQNSDDYHSIHQRRDPSYYSREDTNQYAAGDQAVEGASEKGDTQTSQTTIYSAPPHEEEDYGHLQREGSEYGSSHFGHQEHDAHEQHGEVHYHKHEHVHDHKHKQEHVHKHKQDHDHKHLHNQEHKHDHHSKHKHGHKEEHKHHQDHKHDHHHGHDHKHDHHQEHKHGHHHEHKHQSHHSNKHQHHHGHRHSNKHGHKHIHHSKH